MGGLGDACDEDEQCSAAYASCRHGRCQCIPGANQEGPACAPVLKCPLGEALRGGSGALAQCGEAEGCPDEHYCLYPQLAEARGFCCPRIRMNCPIGSPLAAANCSNCPWDTHYCFSYVIGAYADTMCCPNGTTCSSRSLS